MSTINGLEIKNVAVVFRKSTFQGRRPSLGLDRQMMVSLGYSGLIKNVNREN